ncbi:hypothetical protein BS50DRAFT_627440 [Corynespora cassiicola Philippines]|uniref:Clr5 domain-containing protein n=1 Tax=Corynespora cassiicola Philippines TaxID=1448308 RepID=A0A2T2P8T8_CORCC|nr:hypothetical protein BS50DRAFT_627440 [Corynespora cassiicola Philippines]
MEDEIQRIVPIYVLDNKTKEQTEAIIGFRFTVNRLQRWGIYKNLSEGEARHIWARKWRLGRPADWDCLVIRNGILLDMTSLRVRSDQNPEIWYPHASHNYDNDASLLRCPLKLIPLPLRIDVLRDVDIFENFRRLLWYTNVHFDSCFNRKIWVADNRGVYGRTEELCKELKELSKCHNALCAGLNHFRQGQMLLGFANVRLAIHDTAALVKAYHHRQFPDIVAMLLLIQKVENIPGVRGSFVRNLCDLAVQHLAQNDPRLHVFFSLRTIYNDPDDSNEGLYLAYDFYCRDLWSSRAGSDPIIACYSYNQASLPRTVPGKFFQLFEQKTQIENFDILQRSDNIFGALDHATFCMWHMTIRYLLDARRYEDARNIGERLGYRVLELNPLSYNWDTTDQISSQLNFDSTITFYLLGCAQNNFPHLLHSAFESFRTAVNIRTIVTSELVSDPALKFCLRRLSLAATKVGQPHVARECEERLLKSSEAELARDTELLSKQT